MARQNGFYCEVEYEWVIDEIVSWQLVKYDLPTPLVYLRVSYFYERTRSESVGIVDQIELN